MPRRPPESDVPSPAERFAAAADRAAFPATTAFAADRHHDHGFALDSFQVQACRAFERGENVLVCAPTGAGKTLIGEFAAATALQAGGRCFYTTPIKALSNQKFAEFREAYGDSQVGLLTGDTSINGSAPIVVMTTEVLRNMLYAESPDLATLTAVVLDEVHYLADKFRGAVWEEVILHLDPAVRIVGLSATVSNAEEFGDWIRSVRGPTAVIVDEVRPVPLWQHMMVGSRLYDLYAGEAGQSPASGRAAGGDPAAESPVRRKLSPAIVSAVTQAEGARARALRRDERDERGGRRRGAGRRLRTGYDVSERWRPTPRPVVIDRLDSAGLLPAIVFIFSRAGCDAAVDQCVRGGVELTDDDERAAILRIVRRHTAELPAEDLEALDLPRWTAAWQRGIASHHAGLLPAFKEAVEEMVTAGLVKVVFATETLALGINMPARTVLIERLVKFDGESHVDVTPGEYTQLTGRAGRRGIDIEGHAVVPWSPHLDVHAVAGLASKRTFPLRSSFRPTYNMAVNLVDRLGRSAARSLLERSFAQFQADRTIVGRAGQVDRNREELARLRGELSCARGDAAEYADLVARLATAQKAKARTRASQRRQAVIADLESLRRGDVIRIDKGRRAGLAVVLDARPGPAGDVRPLVITDGRWSGRVTRADFRGRIPVLGNLPLKKHVDHASPRVRADLAAALAARPPARPRHEPDAADTGQVSSDAADVTSTLDRAVHAHPVHECPDAPSHIALARRIDQLAEQTVRLDEQVRRIRGSMSRELDELCAVLTDRGYLADDVATTRGQVLQRIWLEADLVACEALLRGQWATLDEATLAAAVSGLVYEGRGGVSTPATAVVGRAADAARALDDTWREIAEIEGSHQVSATRRPDFGFAATVAAWVRGASLTDCLVLAAHDGVEMTAGDFVRWCRQVIDALDQLRHAGSSDVIPAANRAIRALQRGVVVAGGR